MYIEPCGQVQEPNWTAMRGHGQPSIEPSGHGQYGERSWSLVSLHRGLWLDHNRTAVRGHGQWSAIHRGLRSGTRT